MRIRSLSVLVATAVCGSPLIASAALVAYDGFAYPAGSVVGRNGGTGWGDRGFAYASLAYAQEAFTESYGVEP